MDSFDEMGLSQAVECPVSRPALLSKKQVYHLLANKTDGKRMVLTWLAHVVQVRSQVVPLTVLILKKSTNFGALKMKYWYKVIVI